MYNKAKEHASLNHKIANFSKTTPNPTFLPIKIQKKSSAQTTPTAMYVVKHISPSKYPFLGAYAFVATLSMLI